MAHISHRTTFDTPTDCTVVAHTTFPAPFGPNLANIHLQPHTDTARYTRQSTRPQTQKTYTITNHFEPLTIQSIHHSRIAE